MSIKMRHTGRKTGAERRLRVFFMALPPLLLLWMIGGASAMARNWLPPVTTFVRAHRLFWVFTPPGAAIAFIPTLAILGRRAHRHAIDELITCNGRMCLNCRYVLDQQRSTGTCPECGHPFDLGSLRRGWCRTYREMAYEIDWQQPQVAG